MGDLEGDLAELYVGGGDMGVSNGSTQGTSKWARREEAKENGNGPDICWDRGGGIEPLGLTDLTEEEKEVCCSLFRSKRQLLKMRQIFLTSVNSPIKATTGQGGRENNQRDGQNRKVSGLAGNNAFASPGLARNTNRRRAPSESYPFPTAAAGDGQQEDGSAGASGPGLLRRKTELKDEIPEHTEATTPGTGLTSTNSFGSIKRNPFGALSAGLNGPASPWGSNAQPASPMGAFRGMGFGTTPSASANVRPGIGSARGESRFRDLMKSSVDDEPSLRSKPSMGSFGVSDDASSRRPTPGLADDVHGRPAFGSAALGGLHDDGASDRPDSVNHHKNGGGYGGALSQFDDDGDHGYTASPTYTNPYQSPPQQATSIRDLADDDADLNVLPGLGGFKKGSGHDSPANAFAETHDNRQGHFPYDSRHFDRADTGNRGFPGLGGLGGLPGLGNPGPWSNTHPISTPGREKPAFVDAFNDPGLRTPGAFASPNVGGGNAFGGVGTFGFGNNGTIGRGSKLSSLYSGSVQDQMASGDMFDHESDALNGLGGIRRETDSPFRGGRGKFDDFFNEKQGHGEHNQTYSPASAMQTPLHQPGAVQRVPSIGSSSSNQLPAAQQKTMVMPDRMRWVYKDPQGNTQGPWSGLEMHDWYRAGFFSPELLVKKVEDVDYEPLAQLIRRIGNSREPFLVPQIGIPGPAAAGPAPAAWPTQGQAGPQPTAPAAQPPFAGSFPSFGTTLTADQQNALERRKQEEQYLMHQQKEHLAYQQNLVKQMQIQGQHGHGRQQLSHQQSMQSLHSQASFGSMNSPSAFNAYPAQSQSQDNFNRGGPGPIGAGVDNLGHIREEETPGNYDRGMYNAPIGQQRGQDDGSNDERVAAILADRERLAQEQNEHDAAYEDETQPLTNQRLDKFLELRRQTEAQEAASQPTGKARQTSGQKSGKKADEVPMER